MVTGCGKGVMNGYHVRPDWPGTNFPEFRNVPAGWEAPLGYGNGGPTLDVLRNLGREVTRNNYPYTVLLEL